MATRPEQRKRVLERGELSALAKTLGTSVSHLSRAIRGERPSRTLYQRLEQELGVPVSDIELAPNPRRKSAA